MPVLSIKQVNQIISNTLDENEYLKNLKVIGELSNFRPSSNGHIYFSLKEQNHILNCVIWKSKISTFDSNIFSQLKDGKQVVLTGNIKVFLQGGNYSLHVEKIELIGQSDLWRQFEELKLKLSKEGLFDKANKKQIKKFNYKVGVITSRTGAVIQDIKSTIQRRFPYVKLYLYHSPVQGANVYKNIIAQLNEADSKNYDAIIIARGGGSIEDLWVFNNEELAYAIYNAKTPIISGVGHEIDYTICDFVSDLRVPTPTAAAEVLMPNVTLLAQNIDAINNSLDYDILNYFQNREQLCDTFEKRLIQSSSLYFLRLKNTIDKIDITMINLIKTQLDRYENKLSNLKIKLQNNSINNALEKGFAIPLINGKNIKSINELNINDKIELVIKDGKIESNIIKIEKKR